MDPIDVPVQSGISNEDLQSIVGINKVIKRADIEMGKITYPIDSSQFGKVAKLIETATGVFQHIADLQASGFQGFYIEESETTIAVGTYIDLANSFSRAFRNLSQRVQIVAKKRGFFTRVIARIIDYLSCVKKDSRIVNADKVMVAYVNFSAQMRVVRERCDLELVNGVARESLKEINKRMELNSSTFGNTELLERNIYQMHFDKIQLSSREESLLYVLQGSWSEQELIHMEGMISLADSEELSSLRDAIHDAGIMATKINVLSRLVALLRSSRSKEKNAIEDPWFIKRDEIVPGISAIVGGIQEKIKKMSPGDVVLIPGGCERHTAVYEVKMEGNYEYTFSVFNTGAGREFHKMEGKMIEAYTVGKLNLDAISASAFLWNIVHVKVYRESMDPLYKAIDDHLIEKCVGERVKHPPDSKYWYREQERGTCTHASIEAWVRAVAPDEESFNHFHVRSVSIAVDNLRSILISQCGFESKNLLDEQIVDQVPGKLKNNYKAKRKGTSFRKRMELRKEYKQNQIRLKRVSIMFSKLVEINKGLLVKKASHPHGV